MPTDITEIAVEPGSLRVEYNTIRKSPHRRFYIGFGFLLFWAAMVAILFFAPGKHGRSSLFDDLRTSPMNSAGFLMTLIFGGAFALLFAWMLTRTIRVLYPGAQTLECNSISLTVSQLRWLDWDNQDWISSTYPLSDIARMRYGVLVSGRGNSTYGIRFKSAGKSYKLFPNLTTARAGKLLAQLESLGVVTNRQRKAAAEKARRLSDR